MFARTEITEVEGRVQPYTVWSRGKVLMFTASLEEAMNCLVREGIARWDIKIIKR